MKKVFSKKLIPAFLLCAVLAPSPFGITAAEDDEEIEYSESVDWKKFDGQGMSVNVYNWGEYIYADEDYDVNKEFEKLTGIHVNYTTYASNEEMYAKLKSGGGMYDVIIPSDYMIARMINEGMLEKLNLENIPNIEFIREDLRIQDYDPTGSFSVPYTWGYVGIIYNTTLVDPDDDPASWDILWNEKYAGDILMFSNSRDAFGIALWKLGYSANTTDEAELREAAQLLTDQKNLVQAYVMDEIFDKMGGGEAALAPYYAGDAVTMIRDNPDLAFAIPKEGTNIFTDAACIPKGAKNKEAAEMYINFLCESEVAYRNCDYIGYSTPHTGAFELLDEETQTGISYPSNDQTENMEVYTALPGAITLLIDRLWTDILSTSSVNKWITPIFLVVATALIIYINVHRHLKKARNRQ